MSVPNISVGIEPSVGSDVVYEACAAKNSNGKPSGIVCLRLAITNNGSSQVHLNNVTLSFSSPPAVPDDVIPVPTNWWPPNGTGVNIAPGATYMFWNFLRESGLSENDAVVLPSPVPASVTMRLFFDGYTSPWTVTKTLAPHKNPVQGGAYIFPARTDDLRSGEFWVTSSNTHGTGAAGSQLFAYDMNVSAFDAAATSPNGLNRILPTKDGTKNEHFRVWGKKLHAMAIGVVLHFVNDCANNDPPLATYFNGDKTHDDQLWTDQRNAFWGAYDNAHGGESVAHAGAGNHFYIQHGSEVALYAHMQNGTLNPQLLSVGAPVKAGDFLGLSGNSGNASEPHVHIHTIQGASPESGPLRPLLFRSMFTIDPASLSIPSTGWASVLQQGPPIVPSGALIWPEAQAPPSVPAFLWQEIDLSGTVKKELPTLAIPSNQGIRAHVMLTRAVRKAASAGANCWISKYQQAGVWHNGPVRLIAGQDITNVVFGMEVWNCDATAIMLVEIF
jgi:Peptidase family M23